VFISLIIHLVFFVNGVMAEYVIYKFKSDRFLFRTLIIGTFFLIGYLLISAVSFILFLISWQVQ
jgi:hypothetical protein